MPRPNTAQLAYGSATVICSALAMLLLTGVPRGAGVVVIGVVALGLGLLVALTVPMPRRARAAREAAVASVAALAETAAESAMAAPSAGARARRLHTGAGSRAARLEQHSLGR